MPLAKASFPVPSQSTKANGAIANAPFSHMHALETHKGKRGPVRAGLPPTPCSHASLLLVLSVHTYAIVARRHRSLGACGRALPTECELLTRGADARRPRRCEARAAHGADRRAAARITSRRTGWCGRVGLGWVGGWFKISSKVSSTSEYRQTLCEHVSHPNRTNRLCGKVEAACTVHVSCDLFQSVLYLYLVLTFLCPKWPLTRCTRAFPQVHHLSALQTIPS